MKNVSTQGHSSPSQILDPTALFLERVEDAVVQTRHLADETFSRLTEHAAKYSIACAVESAASTHATLGGNLSTSACGVVAALESAASTHATLGGNLATAAASVVSVVESAASTHATLGGNLATTAASIVRAVDSAASTHATLGGNLASASEGLLAAVESAANTHATLGRNLATSAEHVSGGAAGEGALVDSGYLEHFRTLLFTMLGELPRRGHLKSDFDEMFVVDETRQLTRAQLAEIRTLMSDVRSDWTSDEFLKCSSIMVSRMRGNLLRIAEIMGITERLPATFSATDLEIAPHIGLLNDFIERLIARMGGQRPTYWDGIQDNRTILPAAKAIILGHRDSASSLGYKMLRTAVLENTAQARIRGLRQIAAKFDLDEHPYLTTHDVVEEYHGRDSLLQLKAFLSSADESIIELMDSHLERVVAEIRAFYRSMNQCVEDAASGALH